MHTKDAIEELRKAVDYIDKLYSCDDRDLKCPNPDGLAMALNKLETIAQQPTDAVTPTASPKLPSIDEVRKEAAKNISGDGIVTAVYQIIERLGNFA